MKIKKVLIIRFSSFGDIVQCASVVELISQYHPNAQIDWVTRSDFNALVGLNEKVKKTWVVNKKDGMRGLLKLAFTLRAEKYDHIYDAHNNLRSSILAILLRARLFNHPRWLVRSKDRLKRIFLFSFRINFFPKPFKGVESFCAPLRKWGITKKTSLTVKWKFPESVVAKIDDLELPSEFISLVPSAAWEMKRWPLDHFKKLITLMPETSFVVLGGKEDTFCEELYAIAPKRVINLAGKLSLIESCRLVEISPLVISADTGLLHVADTLGVKGISLMGPTAFGFTYSEKIKTMEVDLECRPCTKDGRGACTQDIYQKCMVDITPERVKRESLKLLAE